MPPTEFCVTEGPGHLDTHGYYVLYSHRVGRRTYHVQRHRLAWESKYGPIPEGMCVLHWCDNPPCWNTDHLFLGTKRTNAIDREEKGRGGNNSGANNGRAKLTPEKVAKIRTSTLSGPRIAALMGIGQAQVYEIRAGLSWKENADA